MNSSSGMPLAVFIGLRVLGVEEIKTISYVPISHPFVERVIRTTRREFLDHVLVWNAADLERKLDAFKDYYNGIRVHTSLSGNTPSETDGDSNPRRADLRAFAWEQHCRGLFQTPIAS